jgi:hypothetical protein
MTRRFVHDICSFAAELAIHCAEGIIFNDDVAISCRCERQPEFAAMLGLASRTVPALGVIASDSHIYLHSYL